MAVAALPGPREDVRRHLHPRPGARGTRRAHYGHSQVRPPSGREQYADIVPGFYSDKRHWNTVYLDSTVPEDLVRDLCDMSYRLVVEKLPKYVQKELQAGQST